MSSNIYKSPFNIGIYLLSTLLLFFGYIFSSDVYAAIAIAIFFIWDYGYLKSKTGFNNRNFNELSKQIVNVRKYLSYFLPFYSVLFGILLAINSENRVRFFSLCYTAGIPTWLLVIPFIIASVSILFVPIQLSEEDGQLPTQSLKALFIFSVFSQQISTYLFVHILLRILAASS